MDYGTCVRCGSRLIKNELWMNGKGYDCSNCGLYFDTELGKATDGNGNVNEEITESLNLT